MTTAKNDDGRTIGWGDEICEPGFRPACNPPVSETAEHASRDVLSVDYDGIPERLRRPHQWIMWRAVERDGRFTKVPCQVNGKAAKVDDSATWSPFDFCCETLDLGGGFTGVGFVFTRDDGLVGVDLDACINADGTLSDWAAEIVERFATYCEISPSGTGLKLFAEVTGHSVRGRT